jgi:hypothetical protein
MSQQFDNNMRGVLFKNDRKEKDTHPDYKGSCEIEGTEMWVSAWIKQGNKGKFMSLSFEKKDKHQTQASKPQRDDPNDDEFPPF